ncbi:MAG: tRNA (N6-threonylcarbamoyladenosine(37)-N6)-methyltransferase TrmO [Bacteroidota bacterium]
MKKITYLPIGELHTEYTPQTGAPRQGSLKPEGKGVIEIYPEYRSALQTLDLFEQIIVIYHMDRVKSWDPVVEPPASDHKHQFGLFATRTPRRPNPIGFAVIKLEKVSEGKLFVSGIDAFDGTPVLDVKPYLPSVDRVNSARNVSVEYMLGHHDKDFITDSNFFE